MVCCFFERTCIVVHLSGLVESIGRFHLRIRRGVGGHTEQRNTFHHPNWVHLCWQRFRGGVGGQEEQA